MRPSKVIVVAVLAGLSLCAGRLPAETLPQIRPAMVGSGPGSLVNLLDAEKLFRKGQRDGWVKFNCIVRPDGLTWQTENLSKSQGADALKADVSKALMRSRFVPAVYDHKPAYVWFSGTVIFAVVNGKPHLRIFANQETDELSRGSDFIAPQIVSSDRAKFFGPRIPGHASYVGQGGLVRVRHSVDASGKTTDVKVVSESPTGEKFGEAAVEGIRGSIYLPAYRNGRPTASTLTYEIRFGW